MTPCLPHRTRGAVRFEGVAHLHARPRRNAGYSTCECGYTYAYDKANRLTGVTNNGGLPQYSYAYDANGNMTSETLGGATTTLTYN
ncbi:MAG: RHS repeat domain-containing protein, partial [Chloroflexota bacterium]